MISDEHNIDQCGRFYGHSLLPYQRLNVLFCNGPNNQFVPRTIFADLEPYSINEIKAGCLSKMFNPESFIIGRYGAANNWAKGYYTEGAEIMDDLLNVARQQVENCDCLQGFHVIHSLGGGSGSGMGSLLLKNLQEEYDDRLVTTFSVFPSFDLSETVVEPYNSCLTLNQMISYTDQTVCFHNESMLDICQNTLKIRKPTFCDLNNLISMTMAGITACFRFPGQQNTDLRKLLTNMCPYPRLHFYIPGFAPMQSKCSESYKKITVTDIVNQMFNSKNQMTTFDPLDGRFVTCAAIFRGLVSSKEIDEQLTAVQETNKDLFVNWVPNNLKTAICDIPPSGMKLSATFISNTTAIHSSFKKLVSSFRSMYEKRAYIHWYTGEGMDENEFEEAEAGVLGLIDEYNECNEQECSDFESDGDSDCDSDISN
jgi:tubulin beta